MEWRVLERVMSVMEIARVYERYLPNLHTVL